MSTAGLSEKLKKVILPSTRDVKHIIFAFTFPTVVDCLQIHIKCKSQKFLTFLKLRPEHFPHSKYIEQCACTTCCAFCILSGSFVQWKLLLTCSFTSFTCFICFTCFIWTTCFTCNTSSDNDCTKAGTVLCHMIYCCIFSFFLFYHLL